MLTIRCALYLLGQIVSSVVMCIVGYLCYFLDHLTRTRVVAYWARFNIWTLKWLCGLHHRVTGEENIPEGPAIIISNHQSAWETLAFQLIFPPQSYLLKKELLQIPIFGWGLALNRPVAIDRSHKIRALDVLIKEGTERLESGRWLVVYPEGSRMRPREPAEFQVGGAMIAAKSGYPIVPVAHNAGVFWPKASFLKYPGVIDIVIGPVIETRGRKAREINREVENWIKAQMETLPGLK